MLTITLKKKYNLDMKISSKGRYAVRLVVDIAKQQNDKYVALKDVSERQDISLKFLEQISRLLVKNGILISGRGATGGYKLAKSPKDITVAEVLTITHDLGECKCMTNKHTPCPKCNNCETGDVYERLNILISGYLNSVSIEKLLKD